MSRSTLGGIVLVYMLVMFAIGVGSSIRRRRRRPGSTWDAPDDVDGAESPDWRDEVAHAGVCWRIAADVEHPVCRVCSCPPGCHRRRSELAAVLAAMVCPPAPPESQCGADVFGFSCTRQRGHTGNHVTTSRTDWTP